MAKKGKGRGDSAAPVQIVIGIPLERTVRDVAFLNFWEIARRGYPLIHLPYGRTEVHRNEFGKTVLEMDVRDCTHLVMLDTDHKHPFDIVERLARWPLMDRDKFQVVSALAFRRSEPYNPCMFAEGPDGYLHYPVEWPQGTILQVHALGHGAIIIDRRVLERLPFPWWQYNYEDSTDWPSEDMYFSKLCREAGINLWVDTTIETPHLTDREITEETFREHLIANPPKKIFENGEVKAYPEEAVNVNV